MRVLLLCLVLTLGSGCQHTTVGRDGSVSVRSFGPMAVRVCPEEPAGAPCVVIESEGSGIEWSTLVGSILGALLTGAVL